ncbi:formylglycine-generating enzyme family protein [Palleronia sediminis]|uniref:Formylglycine-generating enzyme family protein n=1 Tax=Palleronia sediminis TaxID=2547833 RepID=A0A4R6A909_9RHOB|nr:SUMF1/EgtB/PvdO family nonheme iron enzyme [Palleronia sediminis]TDL79417.1 formylglycine-generating enzyme family protein [Palleronia sediminis]
MNRAAVIAVSLAGVVGLAAALGGAAWISRGPDLPSMPGPDAVAVDVAPLDFDAKGGIRRDAAPQPARTIWVARDEVTVAEWNACHAAGACDFEIPVRGDTDPATLPATGLSQPDAMAYAAWIAEQTGDPWRLPRLEEWHALAAPVLPEEEDPIFTDPSLTWASSYLLTEGKTRALRPAGSFSRSPDGVRDLDGSVWEWTSSCFGGGSGADPDRCPAFYVAGEHVAAVSWLERDPARGGCAVGSPPAHLGMRLVSDRAPSS